MRAALGDAEYDAAWEDGRATPDDTISEASAAATEDFQGLIDDLAADEPIGRAG